MKHLSLIGIFAACSLSGAVPEPFAVMDVQNAASRPVETVIQQADYFENLPQDYKKGKTFLVGRWDYNRMQNFHANSRQESPFPEESLALFAPKGDYVCGTFLLRTYAPLKNLEIRAGELRSAEGNTIRPEQIRIAQAAQSKEYPAAAILIEPRSTVPAKALLGFTVLVHAPADAKPGIYRGTLDIRTDGEKRSIPLTFRILDLVLPEADAAFGCYMPFYPSDLGGWEGRWASKDYTSSRLDHYFRFWKTRGFNSPTFFHVAPEFTEKDSLTLRFDVLDRLVNTASRNGVKKTFVFDLRYLIGSAKRLAKLEKYRKAGMDDIAVYKELVRQFLANAKAKQYPRFLMLAEEEIANGGVKLANYNRYGKPMQEIAGKEHSMILDNGIGYGTNAVDRGARDGYLFRQYNSWEQSALDQAAKDGAEVWSYNYAYTRPAYGLIQHRLNSRGHHQWADQWQKEWSISIPTDHGVISSLKYEISHEGIMDYRYLQALKNASLRKELVQDIPVEGDAARSFASSLSLQDNELRRWRAVMDLTGENSSGRTAPGKPELKTTPVNTLINPKNSAMILHALQQPDTYRIDGRIKGTLCLAKNATGPLRYTADKERNLKARSSSQEEFRKWNSPSYSEVWVNYNNAGLLLTVNVNHTPHNVAKHKDDDADMWRDNCMEFFFRKPDGTTYHLMVNAASQKVMIRNGKVVKQAPVQVASIPKQKDPGGYTQEIFVPWTVFDQKEKPADSSVWSFNAAREFHSWNQFTSWGRVEGSFHDSDRWGTLKFSGEKQLRYLKQVKIPRLYPGTNHLSGTIPADRALTLRLTDPDGGRTASDTITPEKKQFHFQFKMMPRKTTGSYRLSILSGDRILEEETIPVAPADSALVFNKKELACISGDTVHWLAELNLATPDIRKDTVQFRITSGDGKNHGVFPVDFTAGHSRMIWLKTGGLPPGDYRITPVLTAPADQLFPQNTVMKLKIYPAVY